MSAFLLVALSVAATSQASGSGPSYATIEAASTADETTAQSPAATSAKVADARQKDARTPAAWRSEIRAALRRESSTKGSERETAVRQLLKLYQQLGQPTNLVDTEQRQLRAQLRSRLQRSSETLATQARRQSAQEKSAEEKSSNAKASGKARSGQNEQQIARIDVSVEFLAQQIGQAPPMQIIPLAGVNLVGPDQSGALAELIRTTISPDSWDPNGGGAIFAQQFGMPGQAGAAFGGGQRGAAQGGQRRNADAGLELVELIQHRAR